MNYKAKPFNIEKHTLPRWAHAKLDGHRYFMDRDGVFSTECYDITEKIRRRPWYTKMAELLEKGSTHTEIEFELVSPGHGAEHVKTALKDGLPLEARPFATNMLGDDCSLPFVNQFFVDAGLNPPAIRILCGVGWSATACVECLLKEAKKFQLEGWVLKNGNYKDWYKIKVTRTIDLIVTGYTEGKGKYAGKVGSLECQTTEGQVVCNISGMNEEKRAAMTRERFRLEGKIVEVKYDRVGSKGKLRFPQFLRWRPDKTREQCQLPQDPALEAYYNGN